MANLNIESIENRQFDAIVIGSGMSGGWAAKELTEKGLKTLVLERGKDVKHVQDYPTTGMLPWELKHRGHVPREILQANPIASRCYAYREDTMHFFAEDKEQEYIQVKPFDWIRGYQVGGKSLTWARQTQRWSDFDFEGPARDGFAVDWPIRYADIAPWYSHVEKFVGISGNKDGLPHLPDGEFLPPLELNCVETFFKENIGRYYPERQLIIGRCAHLTHPEKVHLQQGRGQCLNRVLCQRGCPFGGYFSSNSSTLPWAYKTGNLILKPDTIVHSLIYDDERDKATGVRVIDASSGELIDYYARIIFVNAGTLNTNLILFNSTSKRFPNGFGNDNGLLGKYMAFHNYRGIVSAEVDGFRDQTTEGRRPSSGYIPRFRNLESQETEFLRGYAASFVAYRQVEYDTNGFGNALKSSLLNPTLGPWRVIAQMMGETIPKMSNEVSLDAGLKDKWGMPQLKISIEYDDNDKMMLTDFYGQFTEMFARAGFKNIKIQDTKQAPGLDVHEMGGARMGNDPETSLLNKYNQFHNCKNVFVTDGACMTSTATQNPSLTYMALTARAVDHAFGELRRGVL